MRIIRGERALHVLWYLKLFDELESEYTKLFGKPDEHNKYLCEWITPKSEVKLQYLPSKEDGIIYVDYSPID